jgi:gliding motility-associated-like protein
VGCRDTACISIHIKNDAVKCVDLFVPNAFSPNNDGVNDLETVLGNCIAKMQFLIFDRWGEKVFESDNPKDSWDGTYNGEPMNTAVFVYYLRATLTTGEEITQKGNISLVR